MAEQTILIAEDDADIRDGVRILLAGEGYRILEAENGPKALKLFSSEVDLVILDVMMPGMSGLRVCEELRKISTVPILFLTAKSQESDKLLGLTAGGDDYLAKPFSFAELSARVKALLRRYCVYQGKAKPGRGPCSQAAVRPRGPAGAGLQPGLGGRPGGQPHRDRIQNPAASDAEPPADIPGPDPLRAGVERALLLCVQRHRHGPHPQPADQDRGGPPVSPPHLYRLGQGLSFRQRRRGRP